MHRQSIPPVGRPSGRSANVGKPLDASYRSPRPFDAKVERMKREMGAIPGDEPCKGPEVQTAPQQNAQGADDRAAPISKKKPPESASSQLPPEVAELTARANQGDSEALKKLRSLLDNNPQKWQQLGDLARAAEKLLFERVAGNDQLAVEALRRKADSLRQELSSHDNTPLEKLAIQRVIACWLQLQYLDATAASSPQWSASQATQWARRQESAERRYQVAMKSLGLARRMAKGCGRATSVPPASSA